MSDERTKAQVPWRIFEFMMMVMLVESGQIRKPDAVQVLRTNSEVFERMRVHLLTTAMDFAEDGIRFTSTDRAKVGVVAKEKVEV